LSTLIQTLPATGFSLTGSTTVKMNSPMQPMSLIFGGSGAVIDVKITWDIEPGLNTAPEVVVQKTSALQNWRPTAGAGGGGAGCPGLATDLRDLQGRAQCVLYYNRAVRIFGPVGPHDHRRCSAQQCTERDRLAARLGLPVNGIIKYEGA
jgi:hypothetical protein